MIYRELAPHLSKGKIAPVYLLTGGELFLIQAALDGILETALPASARDFNLVYIDGKETTAEAILNEVQSLPVMADRRVVILKSVDVLPAAEANRLTDYLDDPSPGTCLVVVASKVDARRSFFQKLARNHLTVECHPLPEKLLPDWLRSHARSLGFGLQDEAAAFLVEQVGSDLFRLHNELGKAGLLTGADKKITREMVLEVSRSGGTGTIPDFLEAVGDRNPERSLAILKDLLESGTASLQILGAVARQLRQLAEVKQQLMEGVSESAAMKRAGVWPSAWARTARQCRTFGMEDLLHAIRRCGETDTGIKGGSAADGTLLMEILVIDLCAEKKGGLRRFLGRQDPIYLDRQV